MENESKCSKEFPFRGPECRIYICCFISCLIFGVVSRSWSDSSLLSILNPHCVTFSECDHGA